MNAFNAVITHECECSHYFVFVSRVRINFPAFSLVVSHIRRKPKDIKIKIFFVGFPAATEAYKLKSCHLIK